MRVIGESFSYLLATIAAFVIDYSLLYWFSTYLDINYMLAVAIGFFSGMAFQYFICILFVFDQRRFRNAKWEFALFCLIGVWGLLLNASMIAVLVEWQGTNVMVAKLFASAASLIFNFTVRKAILFYTPSKQRIFAN